MVKQDAQGCAICATSGTGIVHYFFDYKTKGIGVGRRGGGGGAGGPGPPNNLIGVPRYHFAPPPPPPNTPLTFSFNFYEKQEISQMYQVEGQNNKKCKFNLI